MALTPERRPSTGSSTDLSISNPLQRRRYSRAYQPPPLEKTAKGIMVRVQEEPFEGKTEETPGEVLNPEASKFGNFMAKVGLIGLTLLGLAASVVGHTPLVAAVQLLGFLVAFSGILGLYVGLFLWWGSWSHASVQLNVKTVFTLYGVSLLCDIFARAVMMYVNIPDLPFEASYYILVGTLLFFVLPLFVHKDGLNGMFSQEMCVYVGLTIFLDYCSVSMFDYIVPSFLLTQVVCASTFLGLTVSLIGHRFPRLSLTETYWKLKKRESQKESSVMRLSVAKKPSNAPSIAGSTASNVPSRVSYSSVSSFTSAFPQAGGVDPDVINEAHGLIGDLLLKEAFTDDANHKLKRVKELLAPRDNRHISYTPRMIVDNHIMQDERDYEGDISSDISRVSSFTRRHSHVHMNRKSSMILRRTSSRFSTTTTASGMPVLDTEPLDRNRSLALRDVRARISIQEKRTSVHKMPRDRLDSFGSKPSTPTAESPLVLFHSPVHSPAHSPSTSKSDLHSGLHSRLSDTGRAVSPTLAALRESSSGNASSEEHPGGSRQPVATNYKSRVLSQPKAGSLDRNVSHLVRQERELSPPDTRSRSSTLPKHVKLSPFSGQLEHLKMNAVEEEEGGRSGSETETPKLTNHVVKLTTPTNHTADRSGSAPTSEDLKSTAGVKVVDGAVIKLTRGAPHGYSMFTSYQAPDYSYSLEEYSSSGLDVFDSVAVWDFPIFELEEKAGDHILSHMAFVLFQEAGLLETFRIPQREFINYFRALEDNYGANVYHNKTHAADVLHGVSYLLFEMIPEFYHEFPHGELSSSQRIWKGYQRSKGSGGNIASAFSILEVFACYMAAAMHDYDHPGRTNAFLVGTNSPLAVLYNDRSVLENHHIAASWDLLTSVPANNFLENLDEAEMKRFRFLIIEAILATDLKLHGEILTDFKTKVNPEEGGGIDWESKVDRLLVMKMIIKMADINTPSKSYDLHRAWTKRITEEFYQQSEEEAALGLQSTMFMDRNTPEKLPAIQLSFIQNLVSPLFHASAEAGIIPGIIEITRPPSTSSVPSTPVLKVPNENTTTKQEGETSTVEGNRAERGSLARDDSLEQEDIEDEACMIGKVVTPAQNFMSIILTNLQINYEAWQAELPPDPKEEQGRREAAEEEEEEPPVFSDTDSKNKDEVTFIIPEVKIDAEDETDAP